MEKSRLFIFGPVLEFSAFLRFNIFINRLKDVEDVLVTAIVIDSAIDIIEDADDIITISTEYLKKTNSNYPNNLEILGDRNNSDFFKKALDFINKNYDVKSSNILFWHPLNVKDKDGNIRYTSLMDTTGLSEDKSPIGSAYDRDYFFIKNWLSKGNTLKPKKENFDTIKDLYGHLFNDRTFIIITRNFKNKQPNTNTHIMIPNLENIIRSLTKEGIKIINIGFPPSNFDIKENYVEISDDFTQGDLMSLFYLSQGCILSGANGGYCPHAATNVDIFNIKEEFRGNYFVSGRSKNKTIKTYDLQNEVKNNDIKIVVEEIKKHRKISKLLFAKPKKIIFLDKNDKISK